MLLLSFWGGGRLRISTCMSLTPGWTKPPDRVLLLVLAAVAIVTALSCAMLGPGMPGSAVAAMKAASPAAIVVSGTAPSSITSVLGSTCADCMATHRDEWAAV